MRGTVVVCNNCFWLFCVVEHIPEKVNGPRGGVWENGAVLLAIGLQAGDYFKSRARSDTDDDKRVWDSEKKIVLFFFCVFRYG